MKRSVASALLLMTLFAGGVTACNRSTSADTSQTDATQTKPAASTDPAQAGMTPKEARAKKREAVRKQIETVLTPDQVKQLEAKVQQGEKMRKAVSELDLTADQKTKVQEILKTAYNHSKPATPGAQ